MVGKWFEICTICFQICIASAIKTFLVLPQVLVRIKLMPLNEEH